MKKDSCLQTKINFEIQTFLHFRSYVEYVIIHNTLYNIHYTIIHNTFSCKIPKYLNALSTRSRSSIINSGAYAEASIFQQEVQSKS